MKNKHFRILLFAIIFYFVFSAPALSTTSEDYIPSETSIQSYNTEVIYLPKVETNDKEELKFLIKDCQTRKNEAHNIAESARALGYSEESYILVLAHQEWDNANENEEYYQLKLNSIIAEEKALNLYYKQCEYPEATTVWLYLKNLGYSDYVCAGILGNLMTETGGQTLAIKPFSNGNGYYGICQWNKNHYQVWGTDLNCQLSYLGNTIKSEMDTYGYAYRKNFDYDSFLRVEDCQSAALAFAKCYERCGSGSYAIRQKNAIKAYNYFVN